MGLGADFVKKAIASVFYYLPQVKTSSTAVSSPRLGLLHLKFLHHRFTVYKTFVLINFFFFFLAHGKRLVAFKDDTYILMNSHFIRGD